MIRGKEKGGGGVRKGIKSEPSVFVPRQRVCMPSCHARSPPGSAGQGWPGGDLGACCTPGGSSPAPRSLLIRSEMLALGGVQYKGEKTHGTESVLLLPSGSNCDHCEGWKSPLAEPRSSFTFRQRLFFLTRSRRQLFTSTFRSPSRSAQAGSRCPARVSRLSKCWFEV